VEKKKRKKKEEKKEKKKKRNRTTVLVWVVHRATSAGTHAQIGEKVQFQYGTQKMVSSSAQKAAAVLFLLPMDGPSSTTSELWMH
jgi:hypothetical protein